MLYLGVSQTHEAQLNILQALTRKFKLHPDLELARIAEQCPFHYTGADFYALCADALLKAMSRKAEELEATIGEFLLLSLRRVFLLLWSDRFLQRSSTSLHHPTRLIRSLSRLNTTWESSPLRRRRRCSSQRTTSTPRCASWYPVSAKTKWNTTRGFSSGSPTTPKGKRRLETSSLDVNV